MEREREISIRNLFVCLFRWRVVLVGLIFFPLHRGWGYLYSLFRGGLLWSFGGMYTGGDGEVVALERNYGNAPPNWWLFSCHESIFIFN